MEQDKARSTRFAEILASHPAIRIATEADANRISHFLNQIHMDMGHIKINVSRGRDFFELLKKQGHAFLCFLVLDGSEIAGLASAVFRTTYVRNKLEEVGYLQDLRLKPTLSAALRKEFFSFYSEALRSAHTMPQTHHSQFFYSAILKGNEAAKKALSRPRFPLKYLHVASYKAFLFPKPSLPAFASQLAHTAVSTLVNQEPLSEDEFKEFFEKNAVHSFFAATWEDVQRCLPHSQIVVVRSHGKIMAACLLTGSESLRSYEVFIPKLRLHSQFNGVYPFAVVVQKMAKPHETQKWKAALLRHAFWAAQSKKAAFFGLILADVNRPLPLFFRLLPQVCIEGALYRVFHPDHTQSDSFANGFLRPSDEVSLEMSLL